MGDPHTQRAPEFTGFSAPLLIAKGSMGEVWRVVDEKDGEIRALKTLSDEMLDNKWIVKSLRKEYDIARKFHQRNLVTAHRWIEEKGRPGIVMDFVDGAELKALLHEGQLDFADRFGAVRGVVDALHCLHTVDPANWIIHCDIKPENVLVRTRVSGKPVTRADVVLVDYGTAMVTPNKPKLFNAGKIKEFITGQRVVGGSYLYMSPEHTEAGDLDPRSDIYSMGCFMYEVFTGRTPFLSRLAGKRERPVTLDEETLDREELAIMHREQAPDDPRKHNPKLQKNLCQIIMRCLQKDPLRRYQTVFALASELSKIHVYRGEALVANEDPVTHLKRGLLVGLKGSFRGLHKTVDGEKVSIGRHTEKSCDLTVPDEDKLVSGMHCHVFRNGDSFVIEDLESRNGTYVNGRKIKRHTLQVGDKIQFGKHVFRFEVAT